MNFCFQIESGRESGAHRKFFEHRIHKWRNRADNWHSEIVVARAIQFNLWGFWLSFTRRYD